MEEDIKYERTASADYDEIVEFANFVFSYSHEPHEFKTLIAKAYGENRSHWPEHFVARENGRIRALVGLMPFSLRVLDETLKIGFIGTVSVHPYSRGMGHMKRLMTMANEYARGKAFDLLALGGQRQRYEYFGYEPGGTKHSLLVTQANCRHALKDVDAHAVSFQPFSAMPGSMGVLHALYEKAAVCGARPLEDFEQICGTWRNQPLVILVDGAVAGYLIASSNYDRILELRLKSPKDTLYAAVKAYLMTRAPKSVTIELPPHQIEVLRPLLRICERASIEQNECYRLLNYTRVIRAYLKLKQHIEGTLPDGRLALGLAEENATITIRVLQGNISCEITQDSPNILLSRLEAQNLLLAPTPFVDVSSLPDCARRFFPMPICIETADAF